MTSGRTTTNKVWKVSLTDASEVHQLAVTTAVVVLGEHGIPRNGLPPPSVSARFGGYGLDKGQPVLSSASLQNCSYASISSRCLAMVPPRWPARST